MKQLTKEDIFKSKVKSVKCEIPEWEGFIYLFEDSVKERDAFRRATKVEGEGEVDAALIFTYAARNENGDKLFTPDDVEKIRETLSAAIIERVSVNWLKLNGMTARAVEEAEKN